MKMFASILTIISILHSSPKACDLTKPIPIMTCRSSLIIDFSSKNSSQITTFIFDHQTTSNYGTVAMTKALGESCLNRKERISNLQKDSTPLPPPHLLNEAFTHHTILTSLEIMSEAISMDIITFSVTEQKENDSEDILYNFEKKTDSSILTSPLYLKLIPSMNNLKEYDIKKIECRFLECFSNENPDNSNQCSVH